MGIANARNLLADVVEDGRAYPTEHDAIERALLVVEAGNTDADRALVRAALRCI